MVIRYFPLLCCGSVRRAIGLGIVSSLIALPLLATAEEESSGAAPVVPRESLRLNRDPFQDRVPWDPTLSAGRMDSGGLHHTLWRTDTGILGWNLYLPRGPGWIYEDRTRPPKGVGPENDWPARSIVFPDKWVQLGETNTGYWYYGAHTNPKFGFGKGGCERLPVRYTPRTTNWGRIEVFVDESAQEFTARWGVCNGPLEHIWRGTRIRHPGKIPIKLIAVVEGDAPCKPLGAGVKPASAGLIRFRLETSPEASVEPGSSVDVSVKGTIFQAWQQQSAEARALRKRLLTAVGRAEEALAAEAHGVCAEGPFLYTDPLRLPQ